jgi:hypothetical protein
MADGESSGTLCMFPAVASSVLLHLESSKASVQARVVVHRVGACDGRGASVGGAVSPHVMPAATAIASSTRTPAGPNPRRPWTVGKRSAGQTTAIHCQLNLALPAPSFTCHRNHRSRAYHSLSPPPPSPPPPSPPPWTTSASKWSCWRVAPTSPPASTMCRGRLTCSLRLAPRSQRVGILL